VVIGEAVELVWLVCLVYLVEPRRIRTNQLNQINQIDQTNQLLGPQRKIDRLALPFEQQEDRLILGKA